MKKYLEISEIRAAFLYDPCTGIVKWAENNGDGARLNHRFAGKRAGSKSPNGYRYVQFREMSMPEHRLVWAIFYGQWPESDIDHKDGDGSNNAIGNLRLATKAENMGNRKLNKNNTSGIKGVSFDRRKNKWHAFITKNGKLQSLGYFSSLEEAKARRTFEALSYFGEFSRH